MKAVDWIHLVTAVYDTCPRIMISNAEASPYKLAAA